MTWASFHHVNTRYEHPGLMIVVGQFFILGSCEQGLRKIMDFVKSGSAACFSSSKPAHFLS